jgi:predicted amidohydrolase
MSSGYAFDNQAEAAAYAESVSGKTVSLWARLAARHKIVIVGGFCETANGAIFNSSVLVDRNGVRAVYQKAHLWDNERKWFAAGEAQPPVVQTDVGRIGMMICYDLEFPEWVRILALQNTQLLCAPVNWPDCSRPIGERPAEVVRVQADAAVNRMFIAACDRTGTERGLAWVGGSIIVNADGWPLANAFQETGPISTNIYATCRLDEAINKTTGLSNNVHTDRRPELYSKLSNR